MRSSVSDLSRAVSDALAFAPIIITADCSDTADEGGADACRKKPPLPALREKKSHESRLESHESIHVTRVLERSRQKAL